MNILVIGNGFDLAHGLPTTYNNFLGFAQKYTGYIKLLRSKNKKCIEEIDDTNMKYYSYFKNLSESKRDAYDELEKFILDNIWVRYFQNKQKELKQTGKRGWINFESEISKIIQVLDDVRLRVINEIKKGNHLVTCSGYQASILREIFPSFGCDIELSEVNAYKNTLLKDLNRLIRCLEIYLSDYVNSVEVTKRLPDIENLPIDKVLSFNYTNTFERLYNKEATHEIEYDYIHGKADINKTLETCNLVLGIDEYLPEGAKDTDNEFIQFKKFYQRIYKMTGCKYMDWLKDIPYKNDRNGMDFFSCPDLNIYILGHSLDVTDKDILAKLINTEGAKTTIFYHSQESLGNQIANLVKVIGQDNLIARVHGENASIIFKQQQEAV